MAQQTLTLRVPDEVADRLRGAARGQGRSLNAFATAVLTAAVDPDYAGSEIERIRERLAQAGVLATTAPSAKQRPDPARVRRARAAAGRGRPLSEYVSDQRG